VAATQGIRRVGFRQDLATVAREWLILEIIGHGGLIALRQLCGTWWSWRTGGPFAYWDVSRAMLHGDAFWVVAVVCASAIRLGLLAEWGPRLGRRRAFGIWAWLPWLAPGCLLGWLVLIRGDRGAAYILALPYGWLFEAYHVLFFGYVAARLAAAAIQLLIAGRLFLRRARRALAVDGPSPYLPLGVGAVVAVALVCALVYLHIYQQGGSVQAEWHWFARNRG
jgi:hypothetical protein